jgi:hypothetical protein
MKTIKLVVLSSALCASLVFAQSTTTPATGTSSTSTTAKPLTKAQAKAQAKAAAAAKTSSTGATTPAKTATAAATPAAAPAKVTSAAATPAAASVTTTAAAKPAPPNSGDIASAKAKGLVWANLNTKVYHGSSDKEFGTTKNGKFMTEADAKAAGYKAAKS